MAFKTMQIYIFPEIRLFWIAARKCKLLQKYKKLKRHLVVIVQINENKDVFWSQHIPCRITVAVVTQGIQFSTSDVSLSMRN